MKIIAYMLALMIFYDFYHHLIQTIHGDFRKSWNKWYYWPPNKIFSNIKNKKFYNYFWTIFWGIAFVLVLLIIFD